MSIVKFIKKILFLKRKIKVTESEVVNKKEGIVKNETKNQNLYTILNGSEVPEAKDFISKISGSIPEDQTLYKLSKFFSNFSDNTRLKIITCLSFGELCVSDIAKVLNMNQTTISHQLSYLKSTGTVYSRREGKIIYYSLAKADIQECLNCGANFIAL